MQQMQWDIACVMVAGLWWGYNIGLAIQIICLLVFVARLNWQTEAHNVSASLLYFTQSIQETLTTVYSQTC